VLGCVLVLHSYGPVIVFDQSTVTGDAIVVNRDIKIELFTADCKLQKNVIAVENINSHLCCHCTFSELKYKIKIKFSRSSNLFISSVIEDVYAIVWQSISRVASTASVTRVDSDGT